MKLNVKAMGLACGFFRGVSMVLFALSSMRFNYGTGVVNAVGQNYIGYDASILGALLGFLWGFVDGFICGIIFARLYNMFVHKK